MGSKQDVENLIKIMYQAREYGSNDVVKHIIHTL